MTLSPKREAELAEDIARFIIGNDLEELAPVLLGFGKGASLLGTLMYLNPVMFPFFELTDWGHDFGQVLLSDPKTFIDQVQMRVKVLQEEKEMRKRARPKKESTYSSFSNRIKRIFRKSK